MAQSRRTAENDAAVSSIEELIRAEQDEASRLELSDLEPEDLGAAIVFWSLFGVVFAQFFTRYALRSSMVWTEEVARYLLILVTFLGAAMAVRRGTHISLEVVAGSLPDRTARVLNLAADLVRTAFFALGSWLSLKILPAMHGQSLVTLELPMSLIYGGVGAGFVAMTWRSLQNATRKWRFTRWMDSRRTGIDRGGDR